VCVRENNDCRVLFINQKHHSTVADASPAATADCGRFVMGSKL